MNLLDRYDALCEASREASASDVEVEVVSYPDTVRRLDTIDIYARLCRSVGVDVPS